MLNTTLGSLRCPLSDQGGAFCAGTFRLTDFSKLHSEGNRISCTALDPVKEITSGDLQCEKCEAQFPILAGVAILVEDVESYVLAHVKGISKAVADEEIPDHFREAYLEAKADLAHEHIEEDLESERVVALYFMTHYLRANAESTGGHRWWKPSAKEDPGSPLIDSLITQYWDQGPFYKVAELLSRETLKVPGKKLQLVELGCGVGGLCRQVEASVDQYLGVDSSFLSILLARHLNLGTPYFKAIQIPGDLLGGTLSREIEVGVPDAFDGHVDFVLGGIEASPIREGAWDCSVALNAIDMLEDPSELPRLQNALLKPGGMAIQSCPYIWFSGTAEEIRDAIPEHITDSATAVEWMYSQTGFTIETVVMHVPWLFFKHLRQLEVYSVHLFSAVKA